MPSDYENGAKKTIDISIKAEKMTADVLKSALQEFMSGKTEDFKRAFSEYVGKDQCKTPKRGEFTREKMQQQAQKLRSKPRKQKQREKTRENRR